MTIVEGALSGGLSAMGVVTPRRESVTPRREAPLTPKSVDRGMSTPRFEFPKQLPQCAKLDPTSPRRDTLTEHEVGTEWIKKLAQSGQSAIISWNPEDGKEKVNFVDAAQAARLITGSADADDEVDRPLLSKSESRFPGEMMQEAILARMCEVATDFVKILISHVDDDFSAPFATEAMSLWWVLMEFVPHTIEKRLNKYFFGSESGGDVARKTGSSALDYLCNCSRSAKYVLFLGGMATFQTRFFQIIYDLCFVGSFVVCAVSCFINTATIKAPPFYNYGTDMITVYLHVVGLHAWLFWRGFVRQKQICAFFASFFEGDAVAMKDARAGTVRFIRIVFTIMLFLQFVLIAIGFGAFAFPPLFYWQDNRNDQDLSPFEVQYPLIHAFIMYGVLPQHVPTLLATMGLFFTVNRLHTLDINITKRAVRDSKQNLLRRSQRKDWREEPYVLLCCELVECAQQRLLYSCNRWQWLWIHQQVYVFMQIFVCTAQVRLQLARGMDKDGTLLLFTDAFHLSFGALGMGALLCTPALVTQAFVDAPASIVSGLRLRGIETAAVANIVPYLALTAKGFTILGETVATSTVVRFMTMVGIFGSIYLTMMSQEEN